MIESRTPGAGAPGVAVHNSPGTAPGLSASLVLPLCVYVALLALLKVLIFPSWIRPSAFVKPESYVASSVRMFLTISLSCVPVAYFSSSSRRATWNASCSSHFLRDYATFSAESVRKRRFFAWLRNA